jgi:hypothetical protein
MKIRVVLIGRLERAGKFRLTTVNSTRIGQIIKAGDLWLFIGPTISIFSSGYIGDTFH